MKDLDNKLREAIRPLQSEYPEEIDGVIAQIKEACVAALDEGMVENPEFWAGFFVAAKKDGLMTGQEAFNLLRQAGLKGKALSTAREALNAEY